MTHSLKQIFQDDVAFEDLMTLTNAAVEDRREGQFLEVIDYERIEIDLLESAVVDAVYEVADHT